MQFPLKRAIMPKKSNLLEFIDQYFENTPVGDITTDLIIAKVDALCQATPFAATICNLLPIGIELGLNRVKVAEYLEKAYEAAKKSEDIAEVYWLAIDFNNQDIFKNGPSTKELEKILQLAIQNNRSGYYRRSADKIAAQTPHHSFQDYFIGN